MVLIITTEISSINIHPPTLDLFYFYVFKDTKINSKRKYLQITIIHFSNNLTLLVKHVYIHLPWHFVNALLIRSEETKPLTCHSVHRERIFEDLELFSVHKKTANNISVICRCSIHSVLYNGQFTLSEMQFDIRSNDAFSLAIAEACTITVYRERFHAEIVALDNESPR